MSETPKISAIAVTARILAARLDGVAADLRTARWALHANLGLASVAKMEEWADEISTEAVYLWKYAAENEAVDGAPPAAPKAPEPPPHDGEGACRCGKVKMAYFTGTHSMLTKEGERFISTNHRRDRCDREEVIPDPAALAPRSERATSERSERREGEPATFVRCKRCGGSGRMGNPHIIDGWPVRCSECKGTGSASPAAPKEEEK